MLWLRRALLPCLPCLCLLGCGGAGATSTALPPRPREVVEMEELRITARHTDTGEIEFESYDAETLFARGTDLLNRNRCEEAVRHYDRLADEFATSRYRSPALYNAGLCLQEAGLREDAVARYERLLREIPGSPDAEHSLFQLAKLDVELERWEPALSTADALLLREDLSPDERMEAMARRAQALLGARRIPEAAQQARGAVAYYRARDSLDRPDRVRDEFFAAASTFVLAETLRQRSEAIAIPSGLVEEQRLVLERRAQLLLDAQREYFNAIGFTNPHWAAAAGYRIGAMYDTFWETIMSAPTPPPRDQHPPGSEAEYDRQYRLSLARLVKPLIRHSIRYWELTLMMVERTGVRTEWTERIRADLERARARLLEQPEGAEGFPTPPAEAPAPTP